MPTSFLGRVLEMQTEADMREVGVKFRGKYADFLCGRPLTYDVARKCDKVSWILYINSVRELLEPWHRIRLAKKYTPKSYDQMRKEFVLSDLSPKKIRKFFIKMVDSFLYSTNFAPQALLTLASTSGYAINVSKVRWTSRLSCEILISSLERKFNM